jgi:predicted dehydrogenase
MLVEPATSVAVLGFGSIGRRHARNLISLGVKNLVVYDPSSDARAAASGEFGYHTAATLEDVWAAGPSAVVVASPSDCHVPHALEAARRGCHLFVEKPLSHSLSGVEELSNEVRDLVTMVACNMRFHPGPATVKRLLDNGEVGDVVASRVQSGSYLPRWRPMMDYRRSYSASAEHGGAILDCIHEIDLALWYHGPARLAAAAVRPATPIGLQADGLAELLLSHEAGVLSSVHLNFVQRDYRRCCQVIGSRGTLYWDFADRRVTLYGEDGAVRRTMFQSEEWEVNQMYVDEVAHFLTCVQEGRPTTNPLAGGLAALWIALEARRRGGLDA